MYNSKNMSNKEIQNFIDNHYSEPFVDYSWNNSPKDSFSTFIPKPKGAEKTGNEINVIINDLKEKIIMLQGHVQELQRKSEKQDNTEVNRNIKQTKTIIENTLFSIKSLTEQLEFSKDIVESLEVAQQLTSNSNETEIASAEPNKKNSFNNFPFDLEDKILLSNDHNIDCTFYKDKY